MTGARFVLRDVARAAAELLVARVCLRKWDTPRLLALRTEGASARSSPLVDRVAFVIPRVAARLPWRADCLVQALAARRWLGAHGIATSLVLGVRKDGEALAAHAWLKVGERTVTGGDVSDYRAVDPGAPPG